MTHPALDPPPRSARGRPAGDGNVIGCRLWRRPPSWRLGVTLATTLAACALGAPAPGPERPVVSLFGDELAPPPLSAERRSELAADTAEARRRLDAGPIDEEALIWYGRRLAYEFRYSQAIDVFTEGLERFEDSFKLRRHRGHRFITTREFDRAIEDLSQAAALAQGVPDEAEPDGAPNEFGIPRSTNQSNIHYHLGLAHFLEGDFDAALPVYERCLTFAKNDDMYVATAWWLYLTRRRLGKDTADVLEPIHDDMEILENHAYHRLLMLAKGDVSVDELLGEVGEGVAGATELGGVAGYLMANGETERAIELYERVRREAHWMAFGHIAAEAELHRLRTAGG